MSRPLEYWGLKSIAQRMDCSIDCVRRLNDKMQFPLILMPNPRRKHPHNMAFKFTYYSNEALINQWLIAMVNVQRTWRKRYGGRWWEQVWGARGGDLRTEGGQKTSHAHEGGSGRSRQ